MLVHHSFDERFIALIDKLRRKYSEEMFELEGIGEKHLDINKYSKNFFKNGNGNTADKSIDGNANVSDKSVVSWENEFTKPIKKLNALYMLWRSSMNKHGIKRANKMIEMEIKGAIRIHDLHMWTRAYCYASSFNQLVQNGMPFYDKIKIGAIKHFRSFINVSLQGMCFYSNQIAGAIAFPDFFVYADYFIRKDYGENWYENSVVVDMVKQDFQSWIYSCNFSWRSNQSPFVNLSVMDKHWIKSLFEYHANPDYSKANEENVMRMQKIFVEQYVTDLKDNPFTFPIMTCCLMTDPETHECKDQEFLDWAAEINAKTGLFNFYISSTSDSLSSCCRLRSSLEATNEYSNSFGAGGLNIGSHRVVAINFPQIAYETESVEDFMKILEYKIALVQDILDIHRDTIQELIDRGRQPLYSFNFMDLNRQFSTVGFIGLYEALEIMGFDIMSEKGHEIAMNIIKLINHMNLKRTQHDGKIRNIEQIPGEGAASTFAKKDSLLFNGSANYELYSNQYIPLTKGANMVDRIIAQGQFDSSVGGGSILHINLEEEVDKDQIKKIISFAASKGVVYFAINYLHIQCTNCGKVFVHPNGHEMTKSPCHDAPVRKYLRVVGFQTMVEDWSSERRHEFNNRQFYQNLKVM